MGGFDCCFDLFSICCEGLTVFVKRRDQKLLQPDKSDINIEVRHVLLDLEEKNEVDREYPLHLEIYQWADVTDIKLLIRCWEELGEV